MCIYIRRYQFYTRIYTFGINYTYRATITNVLKTGLDWLIQSGIGLDTLKNQNILESMGTVKIGLVDSIGNWSRHS